MKSHRAPLRSEDRHHNARIASAFLALLLVLALALSGCASTPLTSPINATGGTSVQQLLDKAHASTLDMRASYLFDAAALALQEQQTQTAVQILREIDALKLTPTQRARRQLLTAQLAWQQNQPERAVNALQDRQLLQTLDQLTTAEQIDISLLRAQALYATGHYFASAQERVFVEPLLKESQLEQNHEQIRRALANLTSADLQRHRASVRNDTLRGWLDLAIAAKGNRDAAFAASPASTMPLSSDNIAFDAIAAEPPQQVALLLPLTGKLTGFGEAVRDGFLAARFAAQQRGERVPAVRVYDSNSAGIVQLYQQAVHDGAGAVVGPLEKLQVAQFITQTLPVPLLALNRAESTQVPPANLYQFGLAPEDEAAELAQLIARDGKRNVLIIADADEANSSEAKIFLQRWQELGGSVAGTALFRRQDLSTAIRNALNIPRSEARGREIENLLNRKIEFTPQRRRDVDAVFMLAKSAQARSIKPLLNFYYAGDIPVYSTSRIYSGYPGASLDRDLEKVRFTEIPWVLQPSPLKQQIIAAQPAAKNYLRLYALGIDSFSLFPRLRQMENLRNQRVAGQTGALALDAQRVIQRALLLAEMRSGVAELRTPNATNESGGALDTSMESAGATN